MTKYVQYQWEGEAERQQIFDRVHDDLLRLLAPRQADPILDVGCGNGDMVNYLAGLGYDVYGIDPSLQGIEWAKRKSADRFFLLDGTDSADNLPAELAAKKFRTIYSLEVIEHVYDPRAFVRFCRGVLQRGGPGGTLILTTPYYGGLKNLLIGLKFGWDEHHNPLWDCGHIKFWSRRTLTQLLTEAGFRVSEFTGLGRSIPGLWKHMLVRADLPS